ncbi:MAG: efflux RND transporter periplasmic adaptor subunit [Desulfurivibrionaceae bacterium]
MKFHGHSYTTVFFAMAALLFLKAAVWNLALPVGDALAQTDNHQKHDNHQEHTEHGHQEEGDSEASEQEKHGNGDLHKDHDKVEKGEMVHLSASQIREFGIETAYTGPGNIHLQIESTGEIVPDPDRVAQVVPRITGIIREVRKRTGDPVAAGEVLAVIESRELADAKSDYLTADKRLEMASTNFKREKRLWEKEITSEQEFLDAQTAQAEAEIQLYRAGQKLLALGFDEQYVADLPDQQKKSLTRYNITSPRDGIITRRNLAVGEIAGPDSDIFTVTDLSKVWLNLTVYQKDLDTVAQGQKVTVSADKINARGQGVIDYISPVLHEATRTATARVILANPEGRWRPGLFVNAKVETTPIPADIKVPKSAIQTVHEEPAVFVKREDGFEPVAVTLGNSSSSHVEIVSGLEPNTEIAVTRTFMLKAELNKEAIGGHNH